METLYRKDFFIKAIEENKIIRWQGIFEQVVKSYLKFSENDTQHQIQKLEADKAELLEILEKVTDLLEAGYPGLSSVRESKNIMKKHKQ